MSRLLDPATQHVRRATTADADVFGDWLRMEAARQGRSLRNVAEEAGVDHSTLSRIAASDREPLLSTATEIARALGWELLIVARTVTA